MDLELGTRGALTIGSPVSPGSPATGLPSLQSGFKAKPPVQRDESAASSAYFSADDAGRSRTASETEQRESATENETRESAYFSADEFVDGAEDESAAQAAAAAEADAAVAAHKREKKRTRVIEELIASEKSYVASLQILVRVYIAPLRAVADAAADRGRIFSHEDLDLIFLNVELLLKVNGDFLAELEALEGPARGYAGRGLRSLGEVVLGAARKMKGCYTRYVNNFDAASARLGKLRALRPQDTRYLEANEVSLEASRYLEVARSHPDAGGLDVSSFLIMPVQRMPRYRLLLSELLATTPDSHADAAPLDGALAQVSEVCAHLNAERRALEQLAELRALAARFAEEDTVARDLVRYDRRVLREGVLVKARRAHRQQRHVFVATGVLLYAAPDQIGPAFRKLALKGRVPLERGTRVAKLPDTSETRNAFVVVDARGKGYTWLAAGPRDRDEWCAAIEAAIGAVPNGDDVLIAGAPHAVLASLPSKPIGRRRMLVQRGAVLAKYNHRDGVAAPRWVYVSAAFDQICWGEPNSRLAYKQLALSTATGLLHGARSAAFFKQGSAKEHDDWACFSLTFPHRTLDFAAPDAETLLDWYLALASIESLRKAPLAEPLLDEAALRKRLEVMLHCAPAGGGRMLRGVGSPVKGYEATLCQRLRAALVGCCPCYGPWETVADSGSYRRLL